MSKSADILEKFKVEFQFPLRIKIEYRPTNLTCRLLLWSPLLENRDAVSGVKEDKARSR